MHNYNRPRMDGEIVILHSLVMVLCGESYKGLALPRNTTKERTPTINPNNCQSAQLADQAQGTIERQPTSQVT